VLFSDFPEVKTHVVGHLQKGTLCLVSDLIELSRNLDLRIGIGIHTRSYANHICSVFAHQFRLSELLKILLLAPQLRNSHQVLGESTCLIGANVVGSTHGLASSQIPNQIVPILHLADTVGE
jgi:hypothetical protein